MKNILFVFLFIMPMITKAQDIDTKSLSKLFSQFRTAVKTKNETKLKELTLDYVVRKPKINLQEGIIKGALEQRAKGDFAYTDAAVQLLAKKYLQQFKPLAAEELQQIATEFKFSEHEQLKNITTADVFRMELDPVKVVVVRLNGTFKIFYWRDLPQLK